MVDVIGTNRIYNATGNSFALPGSSAVMTGSFGLVSQPPSLRSVTLNSAFTGLLLRFDRNTDQGVNALISVDNPPCAQLLSAATMAAVGADAQCMWLTLSELEVLFGAATSLQPGFNVTLLPGWVKSSDLTSSTASWSQLWAVVPAPEAGSVPPVTVVVVGARVLGTCAPLQLDLSASSGLGSRPAAVQWSLVSVEPVATAPAIDGAAKALLAAALEAQSWPNSQSLQVQVDASLLPAGQSATLVDTTIKCGLWCCAQAMCTRCECS